MKKIFTVWNQAYKTRNVVAGDHVEAVKICAERKFIRRPDMFRKYEDCTEHYLTEHPEIASLLEGPSGFLEEAEDGWVVT